jgi:hypothetical protein
VCHNVMCVLVHHRCATTNVMCVLVHHRCALSGLLAGGLKPDQLIAVSRNPGGAPAQAVAQQGVEVRGPTGGLT